MNKELSDLFYDPKAGLVSTLKLYQKAKDKKIPVSYSDVKNFYEKQAVNQVMRPVRKSKKFGSVVANFPRQIYQMDIIVYSRYKYHNYQYMLCVIDIHSRYADVRAMTNREMPTIIKNFESIMEHMGYPERIQCDNEFNKHEFNELLEKHNVQARFSQPDDPNKNAIVERFNGTLANYLQKVRLTTKKYDWYNYLKDVVYNYNHTVHSTIKATPESVWDGTAKNKQKVSIVDNTFKVGDKVRIVRKRKVFDKGDEIKYSKDIYMVEEVKGNNMKVNGIERTYKPYELKNIGDIVEHAVEEPEKQTEQNQIDQMMKRMDIDFGNILTTKRERKQPDRYGKIKIID
ncbi:MAG: DDE-type integrase/transposase/recombinase [Ignavibacteriaceae bacterium]|nr:DDE-type integrase/transposase/recombinase [Ignavibacteriaceae bacterium]